MAQATSSVLVRKCWCGTPLGHESFWAGYKHSAACARNAKILWVPWFIAAEEERQTLESLVYVYSQEGGASDCIDICPRARTALVFIRRSGDQIGTWATRCSGIATLASSFQPRHWSRRVTLRHTKCPMRNAVRAQSPKWETAVLVGPVIYYTL